MSYSTSCVLGWCGRVGPPRGSFFELYTASHCASHVFTTSLKNPSKSPRNFFAETTSLYPTGISTPYDALPRFWDSTCSLSAAMMICTSSWRDHVYLINPRRSGNALGRMLRVPSGYTTSPEKSGKRSM